MPLLWGGLCPEGLAVTITQSLPQVMGELPPCVVWRFSDAKPGHDNQVLGLLDALSQQLSLNVFPLPSSKVSHPLWHWLRRRFPAGHDLVNPDLIVGAGHATHLAMLAARRARGGRIVVLMKPSLPTRWFDLCLIPQHDGVSESGHVLTTRGVLNRIKPAVHKATEAGLILLGGPSKHYRWEEAEILAQLSAITTRDPQRHWVLTTSRRTPRQFVSRLQALQSQTVKIILHQHTKGDWLPQQLAQAGQVWVSEDSVSMVYEALSSGAAVGLLRLPRRGPSRVARGLDSLLQDGLLTPFDQWRVGKALSPPQQPFNEALRCAQEILRRWFTPAA